MKLIIAMVQDNDARDLIDAITKKGYRVTKLATTGGFLKSGNTTLMIGVVDKNVDQVLEVIDYICESKEQSEIKSSTVKVGGATVFVVKVDKFVKI